MSAEQSARDGLVAQITDELIAGIGRGEVEAQGKAMDLLEALRTSHPNAAEPVAWIKPDWQNPENYDGMSPVTVYERKDWTPLYAHPPAPQDDVRADVRGLADRFANFAEQWTKGRLRDDVIYEFHDGSGEHVLRASDLAQAALILAALNPTGEA